MRTALILLTVLLAATLAAAYTNSVVGTAGGADPSVLLYNETYYFYSTDGGRYYSSTNLTSWTQGANVFPDSMASLWAPDVYYHPEDGKFYMHYTINYKLRVAMADAPTQKFVDQRQIFVNAIDSHLFRDDDGKLYLYFTLTPNFIMYCIPMATPSTTKGPVKVLFQPDTPWELNGGSINEGPWMVKHNGIYYLIYCGSSGQTQYYALGYATATSPTGPFTKHPGNPFFQDLVNISGPGHGSVTRDRNGDLWLLYHQKTGRTDGWQRDICLDKLWFDSLGVLHGTPTRGTNQTAPVTTPTLVWSPDISPRGGTFTSPATIKLSCRTASAEVRYTLDGSDPTAASPLYADSVLLDHSATVKAKAFKAGMTASTVAAQAITVNVSGILDHAMLTASKAYLPDLVYDMRGHAYPASATVTLPPGVYVGMVNGQPLKMVRLR
jgi:hypothetical protein